MRAFLVGQRVEVVRGPTCDIGLVGVITSPPAPLGDISDPRSSYFGLDPATVIQFVYVPGHNEKLLALSDGVLRLAYPVAFLKPFDDDGHERGEWTEELRRLCGQRETEGAT